jgi:small nuclear ribonucleoprotein (snRNP)-like protein
VIELKSDREVRGYLEEVTPSMDVILRQCRLSSVQSVDGSGEEEYMEQHLIAGSTIRFVHLPPNVQVSQVAGSFMKKMEQNERRNAPHKIHESHNSNKRK